jgi:hypothetical protein
LNYIPPRRSWSRRPLLRVAAGDVERFLSERRSVPVMIIVLVTVLQHWEPGLGLKRVFAAAVTIYFAARGTCTIYIVNVTEQRFGAEHASNAPIHVALARFQSGDKHEYYMGLVTFRRSTKRGFMYYVCAATNRNTNCMYGVYSGLQADEARNTRVYST